MCSLPRLPMWKLQTVLCWMIPWVMLPTKFNGWWYPKAVLFLLGGMATLAFSWQRRNHGQPTTLWVTALGCWLIFLLAWHLFLPALWVPQTLETSVKIPWNNYVLMNTLIGLIGLMWMVTLVRYAEDLLRFTHLAELFCLVGTSIAFYALMQQVGMDPLRIADRARMGHIGENPMIATFGNPMLVANFLAVCAPLCLMFRPRAFKAMYGLMVVAILLSHSVLSLLALVAGTVCCLVLQRRWLLTALLLGGIILGGIWQWQSIPDYLSGSSRLDAWHYAMAQWVADPLAPWVGFGPGTFDAALLINGKYWQSLHSEPLQLLYELGVVGMVLAGGMVLSVLGACWKHRTTPTLIGWLGAAMAWLLIACASFPLRFAPTAFLGIVIWAACAAHAQGGRTYATG